MPIQTLPPRLANQIAAGEVVERPASVVKELVENSLDAGASKVDVEVEKGGHCLIRVRDNGSGISKDQLALALSRHATSKISHLDDLEAIETLGFRGEALASISSVSRLTLTSRTAEQPEAWMAYAEGRDMDVELKPAAHPVGTTLSVSELFFNTPARRKFLRAEKTEFQHIEQLMRRIALTRYDVAFTLMHNGRVVHRWPACRDATAEQRRLSNICGSAFMQQAVPLAQDYDEVKLRGWLAAPMAPASGSPVQYCFINGRMIRDKLLTHAMRQAYGECMTDATQASYVIYLELPAGELDVNVHPTKHEVRFTQARLIHDFLVQAVRDHLNQQPPLDVDEQTGECAPPASTVPVPPPSERESHVERYPPVMGTYQHYVRERTPSHNQLDAYHKLLSQPDVQVAEHSEPQPEPEHASEPLAQQGDAVFVAPHYVLCTVAHQLWCIDLCRELAAYWTEQYQQHARIVSQPLLLPSAIAITEEEAPIWQAHTERANALGIEFTLPRPNKLIIRQLPPFLRRVGLADKLDVLLAALQVPHIADAIALLVPLSAQQTDWSQCVEHVMVRRPHLCETTWCRRFQPDLAALFD